MKKFFPFVLSIVLILSLLLPAIAFAENTEDPIVPAPEQNDATELPVEEQESLSEEIALAEELPEEEALQNTSKISDDLMTALSGMKDSARIQVNVDLQDIDHEKVMELFSTNYPEEYKMYIKAKESPIDLKNIPVIEGDVSLKDGPALTASNDIDDEILQRAIETKRAISKELYQKSNRSVLERFTTSKEDQIFISSYAPFAILELEKSTVMEMVNEKSVLSLSPFIDKKPVDEDLDLANQITRADYVRDTYGNKGAGVKIGMIELHVPNKTDTFLDSANITTYPVGVSTSLHATQVARILVGTDDLGPHDGLAPQATLYARAYSNSATFYSGVEWLLGEGVNVINMSAGSPYDGEYVTLDKWVDHIAVEHDVHFVKSAGNMGPENPTLNVTSPGMAYNAITVGAFDDVSSDLISTFTIRSSSCYIENGTTRAEKPNLVAPGETFWGEQNSGTSYSAPQVAGTIAQLCSYNSALKTKQAAMGAILLASAAEKVDADGTGEKGDVFASNFALNDQIGEREGAGVLDSRWARGIVSAGNYWSHTITASSFPYQKTVTINASSNSLTRVAIFWLKRNNVDHATNSIVQTPFTNLNLYVYDPSGNEIDRSTLSQSNFEIVQFVPEVTGSYKIKITGSSSEKEHVGIAVW